MSKSCLENHETNNHRLNNALKHWSKWCSAEPEAIRKLEGGLTNEAWLIQSQDTHFVLRLNAPNSEQLGLDRELEFQALRQASKFGLAPEIIYYDPAVDILITEFLPGNFWTATDFISIDNIHHLVKLLKSIHQLPPIDGTLNIENKAAQYWQAIDKKTELAKKIKKIEPQVQHRIGDSQSMNPSLCVCHNDLLASNLITLNGNTLKAIDWEYAAMGDPFFDLAVIAEGNQLDDTTIKILLAAYIGYDDDVVCNAIDISSAEERLLHCRIIYCYLDILWYAAQDTFKPSPDTHKIIQNKVDYLNRFL